MIRVDPGEPRNLHAVTSMTSISLTWLPPEIVGARRVLDYEIKLYNGSQRLRAAVSQERNFTAYDLSPFTNYTFEVTAVSKTHRGASARLTARTDEAGN